MTNKFEILIPDATYHVYNRANGSEKLFLSDENCRYFLLKFEQYVSPIANTFCYCLMPNHFHFLIRIKSEKELDDFFARERKGLQGKKRNDLQGFKNLDGLNGKNLEGLRAELLSNQFSNFFNAYTKALNKMYNRKGSLFMHTFKRKRIRNDDYLKRLVRYIHQNPVVAGFCNKPEKWQHSSYQILLNSQPTFLNREELIYWFEDRANFLHFHSVKTEN